MRRVWFAVIAVGFVGCKPSGRAGGDAAVEEVVDASCRTTAPGECRAFALIAIDRGRDRTAFALATRGCEAGHWPACKTLGWLHEVGRGTARDPARARALYQRGCDNGDAGSCKSLGVLLDTGVGGPVDRPAAARLYERACEAREWGACTNLANLLAGGDGITRDRARAVELYDRVCAALPRDRACENARALRALDNATVEQ